MRIVKMLLIGSTIMLILNSCGESKIDASSAEAFEKSIFQAKKDMSLKEKEEFEKAMSIIIFNGITLPKLIDRNSVMRQGRDRLDSKTSEQIINEAKKIVDKKEKKILEAEKEEAVEYLHKYQDMIDDMESKLVTAKIDKEEMKKIKILEMEILPETADLQDSSKIRISLNNGSSKFFNRVSLQITLNDGPKEIGADEFKEHRIAYGIKPGETKDFTLSSNYYPLGILDKIPSLSDNASLQIEITSVEDIDKNIIFNLYDIEEMEQQLNKVKEKVAELEVRL